MSYIQENIICESAMNEAVHIMKEIFVGRKFIGQYAERRFVSKINTYRDLILVNKTEQQFQQDMDTVMRLLSKKKNISHSWFGMTCPESSEAPNGYCFWVKLSNVPFGHYSFQIQSIHFTTNEIIFNVKQISNVSTKSKRNLHKQPSKDTIGSSESSFVPVNWNEYFLELKKSVSENMLYFMHNVLTLSNIMQVLKCAVILFIAIIVGGFELLKYFGDYSIKLLQALSLLLKASTPVLVHIIDFFTKMVGGFYILIAMMWNNRNAPPRQNSYIRQQPSITW